jgi:hypothetical protein
MAVVVLNLMLIRELRLNDHHVLSANHISSPSQQYLLNSHQHRYCPK